MPLLDIVDETFVVASPSVLRKLWCDDAEWDRLFTDITLRCYEDRGPLGKRWYITGTIVGSAEVWLEEFADGVLVHVYDPRDPSSAGDSGSRTPRRGRGARACRRSPPIRRR